MASLNGFPFLSYLTGHPNDGRNAICYEIALDTFPFSQKWSITKIKMLQNGIPVLRLCILRFTQLANNSCQGFEGC